MSNRPIRHPLHLSALNLHAVLEQLLEHIPHNDETGHLIDELVGVAWPNHMVEVGLTGVCLPGGPAAE